MKRTYEAVGVCAKSVTFEIQDGTVTELDFDAGCSGSLGGIAALIKGMKVEDVILKLKGTKCGSKSTSCPDQFVRALEKYLEEENNAS